MHMRGSHYRTDSDRHTRHASLRPQSIYLNYGRPQRAMRRSKRTAEEVSALARPSWPNKSSGAPRPAKRWPPALPATAGAVETKSLDRCSRRCGGRLRPTASGASLPRASASVVRQLERGGTKIWSRRGRQVALREADVVPPDEFRTGNPPGRIPSEEGRCHRGVVCDYRTPPVERRSTAKGRPKTWLGTGMGVRVPQAE